MIVSTVTGNVGKDAEVRQTAGGPVCNFSVASTTKKRGAESTVWFDCAIWGKRGETLAPHITKGKRVCVVGEQSEREHNGKIYKDLDVSSFDFMGGKSDGQRTGAGTHRDAPAPTGGGYDDGDSGGLGDDSDPIPF